MRSRAPLLIAALATAILGVSATTTGAAVHTKMPRDCIHEAYKPSKILVACGDGSLYMTGMHWKHWGRQSATGDGIAHLNDCIPFCAAGHFHKYAARVKLMSAHYCRKEKVTQFRRIQITWRAQEPPDTPSKISNPFPCPSDIGP
jgi:hypothetical protein